MSFVRAILVFTIAFVASAQFAWSKDGVVQRHYVEYSSNGKIVATVGWEEDKCVLKFFDSQTGREIYRANNPFSATDPNGRCAHKKLKFLKNDKYLLLHNRWGSTLWNIADRTQSYEFEEGWVDVSPDGEYLVRHIATSGYKDAEVLNLDTLRNEEHWFKEAAIDSAKFLDSHTLLVEGIKTYIWDLRTNTVKADYYSDIATMSPDRKFFIDYDGMLYQSRNGKSMGWLPFGGSYFHFSHDGKYLFAKHRWGKYALTAHTFPGMQRLYRVEHPDMRAYAVSNDGKALATTGWHGLTRLWRTDSIELKFTLEHQADVFDMSFSPDGTQIAISSEDGSIKVWSMETGREVHDLSR